MGDTSSDTAGWLAVCETRQVAEGEARRCELAGLPPVAVFNVGGEFFVTDDTCSHGDASLADGWLQGDEIECPFHSGKFCVRTGQPTVYPAELPIRVYASRIDDGRVVIQLP